MKRTTEKRAWLATMAMTLLLANHAKAMVFEQDKRIDYFEIQDPAVQTLARSVFTFIPKSLLTLTPNGGYELRQRKSLSDLIGLCQGEKFGEQPSVGTRCSGFLVEPDLGATAGHCVSPSEVPDFCGNYFVVFDYRLQEPGLVPPRLDASSVYECREIVKLAFDPNARTDDYAVLRLSRPVPGRKPLALRRRGKIGDHDGVFMLGYPRGLPEKLSPGRQVTENSDDSYFSADLDCFHGNSGSPVFNAKTLAVEGIFVRGEGSFPGKTTDPFLIGDFIRDESKGCYQTLACRRSEGCTATMDSTRITRMAW